MINLEVGSEDIGRLVDLYDEEIAYMEHYFGELLAGLKELGLYDNSATFVLADHGELPGEYTLFTHSLPPFRAELKKRLDALGYMN